MKLASAIRTLPAVAALSLTLTGCGGIVHDELRSSGGVAGTTLDGNLFKAKKYKELQILRASLVVAVASRVAVGTIREGDDADAFLLRLDQANAELNYLAGDLYPPADPKDAIHCQTLEPAKGSPDLCDSRATLFESNLPQLEYKVAGLMYAMLPKKQAAEFAASVERGDVLSVAWKFLKLGSRVVDGAHRGAAAFRSAEEILALAKVKCAEQPESTSTAASCLGVTPQDDHNFKLPDASDIDKDQALTALPSLFALMRVSCVLLPMNSVVDGEVNSREARIERCKKIKYAPALRFGGLQFRPVKPAP